MNEKCLMCMSLLDDCTCELYEDFEPEDNWDNTDWDEDLEC